MRQQYELLPTNEHANGDEVISTDETWREAPRQDHSNLWALVPVILSVLCTLANIGLWWHSGHPNRTDHSSLVRPTTYMGLEKLQRLAEDENLLRLINFPVVMTQVSQVQPTRIWPDDSARQLTRIGTISPDGRRFIVTPEVSTVAQFRAVDYGFEHCSLQFSLHSPPGSDISNNGTTSSVDVWILDAPAQLDVTQLSWNNRPQRKQLFEMIDLSWDAQISSKRSFACPWNSMQSFEFACSHDDDTCLLDFWQDPKKSYLGVTMIQRSSLV